MYSFFHINTLILHPMLAQYQITRTILLCGAGTIYFIAFLSIYLQVLVEQRTREGAYER
jgi:hypothetical protein